MPQCAPAGHLDQRPWVPLAVFPTPPLVRPVVRPVVQEQRVVFPTLRRRAPEHTRQRVAGLVAGPGSRGTVAGLPMRRFESLAPA